MDASSFLVVAVVATLVFGCLGAWISALKGRDWSEGFCLGFLFGPLGCLIAALMPAQSEPAQSGEVQARLAAWNRAECERAERQRLEDEAHWAKQMARADAARLQKESVFGTSLPEIKGIISGKNRGPHSPRPPVISSVGAVRAGPQNWSAETTSPPARVDRKLKIFGFTVSLMNRTEPSQNRKLHPPG